jgi:predicted membrane chloride channel (bestrophin family)
VSLRQKLMLALTAYAVLAMLAWQTLTNEPIRIAGFSVQLRTLTLVVLGLFAFRTLMHYWRSRMDERPHHE